MKASICCKGCAHTWSVQSEPRSLVDLMCPKCHAAAASPAAEDFASALEDALVQLWALAKTHSIEVHLSSESIPASFVPHTEDAADV